MSDRQICPWCQTEIVWDEEIGPEETCPYCLNELGEYRTLQIELNREEDDSSGESGESGPGTALIEELAETYAHEYGESGACAYCGETTIPIGQMNVDRKHFVPLQPKQAGQAFLEPPFTLDVQICPSCLQVHFSLSEDSRRKMEKRWNQRHSFGER